METVEEFNKELLSISSTKPPISKAKITGIVRLALKATHYYKYVVQSVEKYIWKCKPQYKLPGLYVIDAIIHQARLQFKYKDVYAPRFGRNLYRTFNYVFQCPDEDRKKVLRVLNLWSLNDFFKDDVLKPIFELAEQIEKKKQEDAEAEEGEKKSERGDSDNEEEGNKKDTSLDEDAGGMSKDLLLQLASLQSSLSNQNMGDLLNSMQDSSSTANSLTKGIEFLLSNPNLIKQLGELQTKFSLNQIKDLENIVESTLVGAGGATTTTTTTAEPVVVRPSTPPHPEPVEMKKTHTGGTIAPQLLAEESEFEKFLQENEQRSASQRSAAAQPRVNEVVDLRSPDQHHQDMDLRSIHLPQQQSGNSRTEDATKHISTNFNLDDICLPSNLNEINLPPPPPQTSAPPPLPPLPTDLTSDLPMNLPLPPSSSAPPAPMMYHHHNNEHHGNEHHRGGNAMPNFSVPPPSLPPPHAWMMSEPPPPLPLPPHYSQQQDMEMSQEMMDVSRSDETTRGEMFPPRVASNKSASRSPSHRTGKRRSQSPRDRKRSRSREGSSRRKRRNRSRSRDRRRGSSRERRRGGRSPRRSPSDRYGSRGGKGRSRSRDRKRGRRSESPRGRFGDRERAGSREVTRNSRESSVRKAGSKESRAGSREVSVGRAGRTEGRSRDVSKDRERGRSERRSRERSKDRENKAATTTGGDWSRSSRERSGDGDDERDKERRDKGFPCPKKDHISICSKTIWVGHLPKTMEEAELRSMFNEYGDIAVFNLIPPRGCAFVTLTERSAAANALRGLRRAKLGGKSLSLDWAPGKNCKDGQYRDYWNVEQGVTYLPYSCIESTNFESLIEGCSFDLSTVPEFLRSRLEMIQASYEARVLLSGQGQNQGGAPPPDHWAPVPQQPMGGAPPGFFPPGGPQGPPPGWFPPGGPGGPPMMPPMGIRLPPPPAGMQQNGGPPMGGPGGPPMGGPGGPPMGGPGGPFMGGPGGPPRPLFRPFTIGGPMGPRHHMRGPPPIFDGPRGPPPPRGFHNGGMRLRPPGLGLYDDEDDVEIQRENEDEQFPRRSSREGSGEMDRRSEGEEEE